MVDGNGGERNARYGLGALPYPPPRWKEMSSRARCPAGSS